MEAVLSPEQIASYSAIIDAILAGSDLETISAKKIRKQMQQSITYDITPQKDAINSLIHQRFDKVSADKAAAAAPPPPAPTAAPVPSPKTNGTAPQPASTLPLKRPSPPSADDEENDRVPDLPSASSPPPKKKHKKTVSAEDADAMLAAKLQAEENSRTGRTTRGAANGDTHKPKKAANGSAKKKKSKARVTSDDDDSTVESKREVNRTGGFHKPLGLQPPLADLLGETQLSRPQTVKRLWEYIKSRNLQDPSDKRVIVCDDALRGVFGKDKLQMFSMNKQLSTMLYALDE